LRLKIGRLWLIVAAAAGAATIAAQLQGASTLPFLTKPLATISIIAWAASRAGDSDHRRRFILAGLVLSLAGDIALLWPREGFVPGLVAFLLAHLAYIVAFTVRVGFAARWLPFAVYGTIAAFVLWALWPHIGASLRGPVLAYVICLASMSAQAAVWSIQARGTPLRGAARSAAIGGALFMASDALLAVDRFALPLPAAPLWILTTYWVAQACIAGALVRRRA